MEARIQIRDGRLFVAGKPVIPFGAELQYFRVRDPGGEPARTHAMWEETLDRMAKAGMNFVSTYVPWDYHEREPGKFDFAGDRDLPHFLSLAAQRGLLVSVKPGPFITAEWPRGFGSFGAIPEWWRSRNPKSLLRRPGGKLWSFDPLGGADQAQPAYDDPAFLEATRRWFTQLAPLFLEFIHKRPAIALLQLDNETNFFWSDLAHIDHPGDYHARQEACCSFLAKLKDLWTSLGIRDTDVLFSTNDSPFPIPGRRTLLHDGPRKNAVALATLDTYPKGLPIHRVPADQPFQAPYFTRLFERHSRKNFAFAAEIQAMDLQQLFGLAARSPACQTGHLLTHMFGSGLKGGAMYVIREGLNADGTLYGSTAAFTLQGHATARWETMEKWAKFLKEHGEELLAAKPAGRIVVVTHRAHAADPEERGRLWALEAPSLFGWLRMAGFDPDVADVEEVDEAWLGAHVGIVCVRPDLFPEAERRKLEAAAARGATLVEFASGSSPTPIGPAMPGADDGVFPLAECALEWKLGSAGGVLRGFRDHCQMRDEGDPWLWSGQQVWGRVVTCGVGRIVRCSTRITSMFNRPDFYHMPFAERVSLRALARSIFGSPELEESSLHVEAWRCGRFVFRINHGASIQADASDALPEFGWAVTCTSSAPHGTALLP